MISQKITEFARKNGYTFFVNGFGYRKLAEITDLEGNHIGWTANKSASALNSINALIKQRELDAASDKAIAVEAAIAINDLIPPAMPEIGSWEQRHAERFAAQELTAEDLASTYVPRDTFGDDAFALSARYGCGALI